MMVSIFSLLFLTLLCAWFQRPRWANYLFIITLIVATVWFSHHVTSALNIQL